MDRKPVGIVKSNDARHVAGKRQASPAPSVTSAWLERIALNYLDRYSASTEMLRRVLARRIEKRAHARDEEPEAFADAIEEIVARAVRAGLVDDTRFAAARLATLRRRGTSTRGVGAKLTAKGVPRDVVAAALAEEQEVVPGDADRQAAQAYAKRRRLGPHRPPESRNANRERDLAAMARAGFAYPVAKTAIDAQED